MFGKVKTWLGIEGVKIELILPESIKMKTGIVQGKIRFFSMNAQTVTRIKLSLTERYERGRKEEKLIDEYTLGEMILNQQIDVPANTPIELDFELPFERLQSEMDDLEEKNFAIGGIVKVAKWLRNVKSNYRITAEAKVKGIGLHPFDKKEIQIK